MFGWIGDAVQRFANNPLGTLTGGLFGGGIGKNHAEQIADKDYQLQVDRMNYEKQLQQTIFNREDNSVQRRTADLKAAGLNPILAAGQGANTGQAVPVHTPDVSGQLQAKQISQQHEAAMAQMVMNALKMKSEIDHTEADTDRIRMQTTKDEWSMKHESAKLHLDTNRYNIELSRLGLDITRLDRDYQRLILERSDLELRQSIHALETDKARVDRIFKNYQARLINMQTATEELRQLGLQEDIAMKALERNITTRDLQLSIDIGMRYKDNLPIAGTLGLSMADALLRNQRNKVLGESNQILDWFKERRPGARGGRY